MHRTEILQQLRAYQATWTEESSTVERFIAFVSTQPGCFERSLACGHVTGSAWVVNPAGTHVLLTHHRKLNRWLQLGGHADGDPDILRVALREVKEESGLAAVEPWHDRIFDLDIHRIPARKTDPAHDHYDIRYVMRATGGDVFVVSDESHDLAWIEIDEVDQWTRDESMLRMAGKWKQARAWVTNE